jgi:hypothetical protein
MFFLMLFMIGLNTMVGCIYFFIEIHSFYVIQLWLKLRSSSLGHRRPKLILAIPFRHFSILTSNYIFNYFKYIGFKDAWWRFLQKRVVWIEFDIYVLSDKHYLLRLSCIEQTTAWAGIELKTLSIHYRQLHR